MRAWWRGRRYILAAACLCLVMGAVLPRHAQPAIPARPAQQQEGPLQGLIILFVIGRKLFDYHRLSAKKKVKKPKTPAAGTAGTGAAGTGNAGAGKEAVS